MPRTLVVTNDFPPRQGGIETFVHAMTTRFDPDGVVVHTSSAPGAAAFDATLPFPVVRDPARTLLPTRRVTARAVGLARRYGCDSVWFGAAAPLGLMGSALRHQAGVRRIVATTHGHEVWWARTPGARALLARIGDRVDTVTYLGAYTGERIAAALGASAAGRMERLAPGVDATVFGRGSGAEQVRERHGLGDCPVILCAARLVPRKGQDTLVEAMPRLLDRHPEAKLLLVGAGPYGRNLRKLAARRGVGGSVVFAGGRPHHEMPPYYAAADVFAMPCRTRRAGLEVEGLGIVFLEAAAAGLPVLVGDSGGAPDAVLDGETGHVVDGRRPDLLADRLSELLADPEAAREMGRRGRAWVGGRWCWDDAFDRLAGLLGATPHPRSRREDRTLR
ncbi:glycosyltransferase family 4 protein [Kitasatospora sp. NPDC057500]|uniref:glycosyltransferase family 4 protein n=1 Tax=Kitasatospora sp. NPDC057500 TaxID=3346151 RepID=UPI0036C2F063